GRGHAVAETFPRVALAIAAVTLVAGPALAAFQGAFANPAQADVMTCPNAGSIAGGLGSVETVSTVLAAGNLFVPLLAIGILVYALAGTSLVRGQARPALFAVPWVGVAARAWSEIRTARVPEQYRSLLDLRGVEKVAAGGRPVLWLAALVALVFAVTR
ncbi:MAG: hypothetical protein ACRDOD_15305, partial [Streptosporangiaceae bacterium]